MYNVVVAPIVSEILIEYAKKFALDNGMECSLNLVDSFDKVIESLKELPQRGTRKLEYIPSRYHVITFWKHLWLVYQIDSNMVYIDYIIDDRSDYGRLLK